MHSFTIEARHEAWPLREAFVISRGAKTAADVVVVEISDGTYVGRGEAVPYARYGETVVSLPLSVSTVALLRQANELAHDKSAQKEVPYLIKGHIGGGLFGTVEFHQAGVLALPRM